MTTDKFFTASKGTGGRIKKRISDFLVKEISTDGSVCEILGFSKDGEKQMVEKNWPPANVLEGNDQLVLVLEKFNLDQNNAIRELSRKLFVSHKRIGYAGMKDKRAITSQKISVWQPDYEKIKAFSSRNMVLRDAQWSDKRVELGDLSGNEFEITIREIELDEKETKKRILECFKEMENGIPNYFGLQRFGGIRAITHLVGKEFIKGNIETGVMLYLTATAPEEDEETKNARQELAQTNDFSEASKKFPNQLRYERALIHHLCKYPHDFAGAFQKLPKQLRIMFSHAFQSHLFNKVIEERLKAGLGIEPTKGDILEDSVPTAPLYGFESTLADGRQGEIEKKVLKEENLKLSDFKLKALSELSSKGKRKQIALFPKDMKLLKVERDELIEGMTKATISFSLSKGNYATTVLAEILKKEIR